jgi:hypothetical protein
MFATWLIGAFGSWADWAGSGAARSRNLWGSLIESIIVVLPVKGGVFHGGVPSESAIIEAGGQCPQRGHMAARSFYGFLRASIINVLLRNNPKYNLFSLLSLFH